MSRAVPASSSRWRSSARSLASSSAASPGCSPWPSAAPAAGHRRARLPGIANILLGVFNLIPGFPLDGGRVLALDPLGHHGSLRTATHWAARVGQVVAFLFIFCGVSVFTGNFLGGIWIGFIGWFLLQAAQSANNQACCEALLRGVTVAMRCAPSPPPSRPTSPSARW